MKILRNCKGYIHINKIDIDEEWKPLIYPHVIKNKYFISNKGRLKDIDNRILITRVNKKGYVIISLKRSDRNYIKREEQSKNYKEVKIHRAVALAFIDNPKNLSDVNHIDSNKENNRYDNLEWASRGYDIGGNSYHKLINNRQTKGESVHTSKLTEAEAIRIIDILESDNWINDEDICRKAKLEVNKQYLRRIKGIRLRENWKYLSKGKTWKEPKRYKQHISNDLAKSIKNLCEEGKNNYEICDELNLRWSEYRHNISRIRNNVNFKNL